MSQRAAFRNPFWSGAFADPFLLKVRGRYLAYATEPEERPAAGAPIFPILTSEDLVTWRPAGQALLALGEPYFRYWAPEVTEHNGQFLLYYAVHTESFRAAIRVAVADHAEGPFRDTGHDLTSRVFPWAIDPHVFRDDDGLWYLFYTTEYVEPGTELVGSGNVVDRLLDPFTAAGTPARVTPPRHAWQLFERRREEKGGVDWYCVEGPAVIRHRGRVYEMFSGGCYYRDNYAVSYATAPVPMGSGGMHDTSWEDHAADESGLLMQGAASRLVSPGHNSIVTAPNNIDLYMAYHAWPVDRSERRPCLDRLYWHGDVLWTPGPTVTPQPAPTQPRLHEPFRGEALDPAWAAQGGHWRQHRGMVSQVDQAATMAALTQAAPLGVAWLLEVNVRHMGGVGIYGVDLRGEGERHLTVLMDPRSGTLETRPDAASNSGAATSTLSPDSGAVRSRLPAGFRPDAWHQLLIAYAGSMLTVRLDGLPALQATCAGLTGSFALSTERCSAAFTAIALTDHFRDEFLDADQSLDRLGWRGPDGAKAVHPWRTHDGAVEQPDTDGEQVLLKGSSLDQFECGATMRLLDTRGTQEPSFGLLLSQGTAEAIAVLLTRRGTQWHLQMQQHGAVVDTRGVIALPADFDARRWHTLRLVRDQSSLAVSLDGPETLVVAIPSGSYSLGLLTQSAAAAFTGVWQTGTT